MQKEGFRTVVQPSLQLYVQDAVNENFKLALGSVSEISTVTAPPVADRFGGGQYGGGPAGGTQHAAERSKFSVINCAHPGNSE
jgi:hypothetical protein